MANSINFLNKNFSQFNETLQQYIRDRFPNEYTDITQANPGQMFIDLAAYVGTVNSFYLDNQLQNVLPQYSTDMRSLLSYAYVQGYPIRPTTTANVEIEIKQLIPVINDNDEYIPDWSYAMYIPANTQISSGTGVTFLTESSVDFSHTTYDDPTDLSIYSYNSDNEPEMFVATKKVQAIAGILKTQQFSFTSPVKFNTIQLSDTNILFIQSAIDSAGNKWYEVPYLGQNTIFKSTKNIEDDSDTIKYVIGVEKVPKRFVARFRSTDVIDIEFGSGIYGTNDIQLVPTLDAVKRTGNVYNNTYDPVNPNSFLYTKEYGEAPSNTTITFTYVVGGGNQSNIPANSIVTIDTTVITFNGTVDPTLGDLIKQNVTVNNPNPAVGGRNTLSLKDIRNVLIANFSSQDRAINKEDYAVRCLSLPPKYGNVAKSFVQLDTRNSSVVNISALALDNNGAYTNLTTTLKTNLSTYLDQFKSLSDKIVINDAYIINVAVEFELTIHPNNSPKYVLNKAISKLQEYFSIENWQINQPILISDIIYQLSLVEGVQSVVSVNIVNKSGGEYSPIAYDITAATRNNVIYPSIDPSIFEIKFPQLDIYGRVKNI